MRIVGKITGSIVMLLLICTVLSGCAPAHTPPVDLNQNSVLLHDTRRPSQTVHTLIVEDHLLVVLDAAAGRSKASRQMFAVEHVDAATRQAILECTTLVGEEPSSTGSSRALVMGRAVCPNSRVNQIREETQETRFPGGHPLQAALDQIYDAVNSPGYEVNSAPTWAFRCRTAIETLHLDAAP